MQNIESVFHNYDVSTAILVSNTTETMSPEIELLIYAKTFYFVTLSLYRNQAFLKYVDCNGQDEVELLLGFELH